jgi:hypothetical protein
MTDTVHIAVFGSLRVRAGRAPPTCAAKPPS